MATYKVIQDIEAEDKFLGPLTLKQFIFGASAVFFGYLSFFAAAKGAGFLMVFFLPPAFLGAFLAIPWSSDQPTEVWVVAKLRFKFKPKARIWDQAGLEELVTVTAPKVIEKRLTNGLDPTEVQSRLKALAETIDSRGWAVKNATLGDTTYNLQQPQTGERLINVAALPQQVPDIDLNQIQDVLDEDTTVSENFQHLIQSSATIRRQQSLEKMDRIRHGESLEAVQQPEIHFTPAAESYGQNTAEELAISQQLRNKREAGDLANNHMRTLSTTPAPSSVQDDSSQLIQQPVGQNLPVGAQPQAQMTNTPDPAILNLAQNNDWTVDTIARNAKKNDPDENEVVVSLR
jgi:hypothetical protein